MSTYTDICNKVKETLVVDYHSRITPQRVNFVNPKNSFTGEMHAVGNSSFDNINIKDSIIENSTLDNVYLKNGINVDNVLTTLPLSVSTLEQNLSIALSSETGTGDILKTYTITQGNREVGKIDIPKDMVIEAAGLVVYDGISEKFTLNGKEYSVKLNPKPVAGEYIVMITSVTENQIWIPIADLVHDSIGGNTTTISVRVSFDADQGKNVIKADVLSSSISRGLLSTDVKDELNSLRTDINTVSTDLGEEVERASASEEVLSGMISDETATRITNDDILSVAIDEAVDAAETAIQQLANDITAEETRAIRVEEELEAAAALSVTSLSIEVDSWLTDSSKNYVNADLTGDNKIATIKDVVGLSGVTHFRGIDDAFISGDATTVPNTDWYSKGNKPVEGDIIINSVSATEFLFTGSYSDDDPTTGKWRELGNESLHATKAELAAEVERAKDEESTLSDAITTEAETARAAEQALTTALTAEVERAIEAEETLQDVINTVATVSNDIDGSGEYHTLSVIKIEKDKYDDLVANDDLQLSGNALFVVDSDYFDVYGQVIKNLSTDGIAETSEAANTKYVDGKVNDIKNVLRSMYSKLSRLTTTSEFSDVLSVILDLKAVLSSI